MLASCSDLIQVPEQQPVEPLTAVDSGLRGLGCVGFHCSWAKPTWTLKVGKTLEKLKRVRLVSFSKRNPAQGLGFRGLGFRGLVLGICPKWP